ncbi:carbamate kinase [Thermoanaerobacteraceae bacterium SP2]|nr:carbamate kinase [Thermoanaerobacteraceae bacterium SP2]
MSRTVVVALGGNAILSHGQKGFWEEQLHNVNKTAQQIISLISKGYHVVVSHGNGPQVGNIYLQNQISKEVVPPLPLYACGAESQGYIGFMLQQSIKNMLAKNGIDKQVVTLVTQVLVDKNDEAFKKPTKPIGPFYNREEAMQIKKTQNIEMIEDGGRGWRRVVPSPKPLEIIEKDVIKNLVSDGVIVIASGGGGIPVIKDEEGNLKGIDAVIDKDLASALLASELDAEILLILTDVEKVCINYNKPDQREIDKISTQHARQYLLEGHFGTGSMKPKVEAAISFVENSRRKAIIAKLDKLVDAICGNTGTCVC